MVTHAEPRRFALRPGTPHRARPDAAWWPETRSLNDQLPSLFALWPAEAGRIGRILYSPPDWDDHPRKVIVRGKWVKTGSFPRDDTHLVTVSLLDGRRRAIVVIPPATDPDTAAAALDRIDGRRQDDQGNWDNEGGHV